VSFFYIALEQIEDEKREAIQHNAIATRGSKSEKLEEFLKLFDKKKKQDKVSDHESNLAMLSKKL